MSATTRHRGTRIGSGMKRRFLLLALFALLVQATLPYLSTTCPLYTIGQPAAKAVVQQAMADCPLMAGHHQAAPADTGKPGHDAPAMCPLCAVMSPLHGFVVAGLIALPPPPVVTVPPTNIVLRQTVSLRRATAAFSARAPPFQV